MTLHHENWFNTDVLLYILTYTCTDRNIKLRRKPYTTFQSSTTTVDTSRDLGMMLDSQLTMSSHVGAVCQSAHYYLRQLRTVVRALSVEARKTVVHAFVSSRLDYCNSLLSRLKPFKMLPHVSSLTLADASISR